VLVKVSNGWIPVDRSIKGVVLLRIAIALDEILTLVEYELGRSQ
jgi:hypothetical protein